MPQAELFQLPQLAKDLFKALSERIEDFEALQLSDGALVTVRRFIGVRSFGGFWHGTRWDHVGRSLKALASSRSAAQKGPASGPKSGNPRFTLI